VAGLPVRESAFDAEQRQLDADGGFFFSCTQFCFTARRPQSAADGQVAAAPGTARLVEEDGALISAGETPSERSGRPGVLERGHPVGPPEPRPAD
jgi:hypothetical protein